MINVAEQAIQRSISHTEIVTIDYDAAVAADLAVECDDSVEANEVTEYWGTDADGNEWRVHMRRTEAAWWAWHDADSSRWSPGEDAEEAAADAERRCASWVAGESDDGPSVEVAPRASLSSELRAGIVAYRARIAELGGYGIRVRATMPNGMVREGRLFERGFGGCQPGLVQDDGREFAILDLATAEVAS